MSDAGIQLKKFVSKDELDDQRKKRQEEWEKVRKPDQPQEAPEEVYDPRSLYHRLEEQKQKQQDEHDDQFKLKNQVKGLEEDEAAFLDYVSDRQIQLLQDRRQEEQTLLEEYRNTVVLKAKEVQSTNSKSSSSKPVKPPATNKKSQLQLLAGAVKRKSTDTLSVQEKKLKESGACAESTDEQPSSSDPQSINKRSESKHQYFDNTEVTSSENSTDNKTTNPCSPSKMNKQTSASAPTDSNVSSTTSLFKNTKDIDSASTDSKTLRQAEIDSDIIVGRQVIGVLPGLGVYSDSDCSDDDSSSSPISTDDAMIVTTASSSSCGHEAHQGCGHQH